MLTGTEMYLNVHFLCIYTYNNIYIYTYAIYLYDTCMCVSVYELNWYDLF